MHPEARASGACEELDPGPACPKSNGDRAVLLTAQVTDEREQERDQEAQDQARPEWHKDLAVAPTPVQVSRQPSKWKAQTAAQDQHRPHEQQHKAKAKQQSSKITHALLLPRVYEQRLDSRPGHCFSGTMAILAGCLGVLLILLVLLDAFETVIMPRRAIGKFRLTRLFYVATWTPWCWASRFIRGARRRETMLAVYGPLSLVLLIALWALGLLVGFGLCYWAGGSPLTDSLAGGHPDLRSDLYVSGTTLFTLGLGDVVPRARHIRELLVVESGMGLGFVAVVIGYFPVLYGAFSRREVSISMLDARAGSPPSAAELMRRHAFPGGAEALTLLLEEWERWAAELLESHISYPLLCYFRSQHTNQSWLSALCAVLDTCALMVASVQDLPGRQAQLTFAMARHAVVDLSQVFELEPVPLPEDRLPLGAFSQLHDLLCQAGTRVARDQESYARLNEMRGLYEPYVATLARHLVMDLPPFITDRPRRDNWQTVARLFKETQAATPDPASIDPRSRHPEEEHHIF